MAMKMNWVAGVAALAGAGALLAGPVAAAPHFGGGHFGGGHFGGAHTAAAGHFSPSFSGAGRNWTGRWGGRDWGRHHGFIGCCFYDPFFYDPFFWGGFAAGYDLVPYWDDYDTYGDGYGEASAPAAPPGYDCDGWRWDVRTQRYVAAKVACQ